MSCFVAVLILATVWTTLLRALGLQWHMGAVIVLCLWVLGFPLLWYTAKTKGGGLIAIWMFFPLTYAIMNVGLMLVYMTADWEKICREQIFREQNKRQLGLDGDSDVHDKMVSTERTRLMASENGV